MRLNLTNILLAGVFVALAIVAFGLFHKTYVLVGDESYFCSENPDATITCARGAKGYRDGAFLVKKVTQ